MAFLKKGVKVRTKGTLEGIEGVVTGVHAPKNCTESDHGSIQIIVKKITNSDTWPWLVVGDTECVPFYQWDKFLDIIE